MRDSLQDGRGNKLSKWSDEIAGQEMIHVAISGSSSASKIIVEIRVNDVFFLITILQTTSFEIAA